MQVIKISDPNAISQAIKVLRGGGIIIYPTETCYGIGADANSKDAITKLLEFKGDRHRQVSVAVPNTEMAKKFVNINSMASNLYQEFLPGPMTIISQSLHKLDSRLESESGTLGIRIPKNNFALKLLKEFGSPLTATSANTSGRKEPYSLEDWQKYTSSSKQKMVTLFLDGGRLAERPTSTVVDTTLNAPEVLRQGELTLPSSSPSITSISPEQTQDFAANLLNKHLNLLHKYPLIFALQGNLGAGKTQFAKGLGKALSLNTNISSPTYTLLKEYPYALPKYSGTYYHIDTWRLSEMAELESTLHLSNRLKKGNIVCLEWAGKAKEYLNKYKNEYPIILIDIKELEGDVRTITYAFSTPEWS